MTDKPKRLEKCLEIIKCSEGNKEFLKERKARSPLGKLARRAARYYLRVSIAPSAIVWQRPRAIRVYRVI